MLKPGVRGNLLLAFAVIVAGAATGIAISYSARAQVGTFDDDTEYGNPDLGVVYCTYIVHRTNGNCAPKLNDANEACTPCIPNNCPDFGQANRLNAQYPHDPAFPNCQLRLVSNGPGCTQCNGVVLPHQFVAIP
jgi:hypothetical protein